MDDGRIFLYPIKKGWRWMDGELRYREEWREEDKDLSNLEVTRRALHGTLQGVDSLHAPAAPLGQESEELTVRTG